MKTIIVLVAILGLSMIGFAQTDLQKLVDSEHSFAAFAAEHDTRSAFLEFMASDAVVFQPDKANGPAYWNARGPSNGLLSWTPNYADVSTNGILGYTTGNWEYRPKGKDDAPVAFGDFITVWLRQPSGKYKFVVDIGIGHEKPEKYSTEWVTSKDGVPDPNLRGSSAPDVANSFFDMATKQRLRSAYEQFAASDIRLYREEKMPFIGKKNAVKAATADKGTVQLSKKSVFFGATNLSYTTSTYSRMDGGKVTERGNYLQIWKLKAGKWYIVIDIFKPVPEK